MEILHFYLRLNKTDNNYVELRYFENNPNVYQKRSFALSEISDLIQLSERDYYVPLPEDYRKTGTKLFNWLDGNDRFFQQLLDQYRNKAVVLAISAGGNLAHLPWELLHDGKSFLVEKRPGIVPVRWVSSDSGNSLSIAAEPENRPLQMLFMAASPLKMEPVLDFEKEEASILSATKRQPLTLTVEESGCLEELGYLVEDYGKGYFDVLHLTGHATIKDGIPAFITESATGEAVESTADDIATELQFQLPKLIFLSGCRTGQAANCGAVPSMAECLLNAGANSVLGWGQKVLDTDATLAAATLYQALSSGKQLTESLALTYQALIKNKARDWHLLRLYIGDNFPGNLVTPLRTRGRKPAISRSSSTEFLDAAGKVKVPTRESFVGRRRQLQSCLRTLINPSSEKIGVLIHGMGGLGKSSLAARLCDRLTNFQRVVWVGEIDEPSLVNRLTEKLDSKELRETLQNPDEELKFRLKRVFGWLQETGDKPFLFILDDFEANLEPRNDSYILLPESAKVLSALVWSISESYGLDRIIITSRYDIESNYLQQFYKQPLEGMRGAELRKKLNSLATFNQDNQQKSQVEETLQAKAQQLADGNPRLLEWLDKILQSNVDIAAILNKLELDSGELREQVLAKELLQQMDDTMREMLQLGLVFELPVPREALESVCETIVDLDKYIDKAIALGLLEVSPDGSVRVPRILPLELSGDVESLSKKAAQVLYRLWWEEKETSTEEEKLEIHRLSLLGRETEIAVGIASVLVIFWNNRSRFKEAITLCKSTLNITEDYRILHQLARSEEGLGDLELAEQHYQQALELCSQEDEKEKTTIIHNFAGICKKLGNIDYALTLYQQSSKLSENIGYLQVKAASLHQIAGIYAQLSNMDKAIDFYRQSLELKEEIGDVQGKAVTLNNLADIYVQRGNADKAIKLCQQSLKLIKETSDEMGKAKVLAMLAQLLAYEKQEFTIALNYLHQSFEIFQHLKSPYIKMVRELIFEIELKQFLQKNVQA
ncbi:TPR repeat-containing protein [Calothrix parasitica NIES-267]|uniref:TPR repeat-containing protein n=1 Tax=Calothrix parasitica NIES-267 TaxID=1973488 RepID=A0A1Z4LMB8_9CYAN|nr:TPR repeat-containing protein [Calothrix parasitica NIES-267]